jgi:DAK2 domain fusion protein YloV
MTEFQGSDFLSALRMALLSLNEHAEELNRMNVFPVPDGDTGLNMSKTLAPILRLENDLTLSEAADAVSEETLKASRGNSGTILATFFIGFAEGLTGLEKADPAQFMKAVKAGRDEAYLSVATPTEGTILTVMSAASTVTPEATIEGTLKAMEKATYIALENTPNLLPILKKSGVVDSGGLGFYYMVKAFLASVLHQKEEVAEELKTLQDGDIDHNEDLTYRFCTEGVLRKNPEYVGPHGAKALEEQLSTMGGSIVYLETASLIKFHIHTNDDELVRNAVSRFGILLDFKADNLFLQVRNENYLSAPLGFVIITDGDGFAAAFSDFEIQEAQVSISEDDASYEEIEKAVQSLKAKRIVIFPNSKNIIPTCLLLKRKYPTLEILPTKDQPSAIAALEVYDAEKDAEENLRAMQKALERSKTLALAVAEKDYSLGNVKAKKGDWLLLKDSQVIQSAKKKEALYSALADEFRDENEITVYYGESVPREDADALSAALHSRLSGLEDIILVEGDQLYCPYFLNGEKA